MSIIVLLLQISLLDLSLIYMETVLIFKKKFITFLWIIFTTLKTLKFNYCKTLDY